MAMWLLLGGPALLAVLIAIQLLIPKIAESRIATRLTDGGGEATVSISALPALRLLWREGDRLEVRGREVAIGLSGEGGGLSALDGFTEVDIRLHQFTTGPFEIAEFELVRQGPGPYLMRSQALTSGVALLDYGGAQFGLAGSPLLTALARQAPLGARSFPVAVEVELASEAGLVRVASGGGTIAGYPAGPLASAIAAAVARRLEIAH